MQFLDRLIHPLARLYEPRSATPSHADGIIGIGIALRANGEPSNMTRSVALKCGSLIRNSVAQQVLLTGGYEQRGITEAGAMREILISEGVPVEAVLLETASTRTHLNALFTRPIVERLGWRRLVLVAHYIHARRARAIFERCYGRNYEFELVTAHSEYELLPQRRLSSEARFLITWELPNFALAKLWGWA